MGFYIKTFLSILENGQRRLMCNSDEKVVIVTKKFTPFS